MPTFTAIAFDRLIEPRESKSVDMPVPNSKPPFKSKPAPHPNSKLERRNSTPVVIGRKDNRPPITPALYTTPEPTPLPDSPTSFSPSPYIVNHKRRGPRLVKSFSQADVALCGKPEDEGKVIKNATKNAETKSVDSTNDASVSFTIPVPVEGERKSNVQSSPAKELVNGFHDGPTEKEHVNGVHDGEPGSSNRQLESSNRGLPSSSAINAFSGKIDVPKLIGFKSESNSECEDFFDPQESMSVASNTDGEDNTWAESSAKLATPKGEFYDAWEELSSDGGSQSFPRDIETELHEVRLSLLMELEKRKQAEEALNDVRSQWQGVREQLAHAGLTLPADPTVVGEDGQLNINLAEELCQKLHLARFVSESIGRGIAKAEMEAEMEAQIEAKNFEIARLWDRLHYYEAMNREMSQRNQEAVEMTRRNRQRRKRKQRWVWGSIAAAITLGTAALVWSYLPTGKESTSSDPGAPEHDDAAK
ncbi:uncharacterized protein LOC116113029 [Pistacia vera]|uniref:uncharacterized protein LOC116113029 n=1 Tax=Pistacia vera TaxID=55513 RepID=UPI001262EBB8|nr:uncharacterized protein LOC116113029 [Pistacia vera]